MDVDTQVVRRGKSWILRRRVPQKYQGIEPRKAVWKVLHAKTEAKAQREASQIWSEQCSIWQAKLITPPSNTEGGRERYQAILGEHKVSYLPVRDVARLPIKDVMRRMDLIYALTENADPDALCLPATAENKFKIEAFLGTPGAYLLSDMLDIWIRQSETAFFETDPLRRRRWEARHRFVIQALIDAIGDIAVESLRTDQVARVAYAWLRLGTRHPRQPATVNGMLQRLHAMVRFMQLHHSVQHQLDFGNGYYFRKRHVSRRPAFSKRWIQDKILEPNALHGLDGQLKALLLGMLNTGYRVSEGANLMPDEIQLAAPIPHLSLMGRHGPLKTQNAYRNIPLVGVSLEAFREYPQGFKDLRGNPEVSAKLNRFLTSAGLRESARHSVHSFRHSFASRLSEAWTPDTAIAQLMGHAVRRGYGRGLPVAVLAEHVQKIAF